MKKNKQHFDDGWKIWIWGNVSRGCSKDGIFRILIDEGFEYSAIKNELNYEPSQDITLIANPLTNKTVLESDSESSSDPPKEKNTLFFPKSEKIKTDLADIFVVDNFLNKQECEKIVELIKQKLAPSTITNKSEEDTAFRTSKTCSLSEIENSLIKDVDRRICQYLGINPSYSEKIQGQHYEIGEEFKAHTDYFEINELEEFGATQGQRTWTFMIYLNDSQEGGETLFKNLDVSFNPQKGQAVIWCSLYPNGCPNPDTIHQSKPVLEGEKTIITKWFRSQGLGRQFTKTPNERIAPLTNLGFCKRSIPNDLLEELIEYYEENRSDASEESVKDFIKGSGSITSELIELPQELRTKTHDILKPILEKWAGIALQPTYVYGIRCYRRGARLLPHRDRLETHIVSATVNIFQDINEQWSLDIEDHFYRNHSIFQRPGEMIMYEGARLQHGRPKPFKGNGYASIFVHYKPL